MLCEKCGKREATSHYKQTVNGQTAVMHVCQECAAELGFDQLFHGFGLNIGEMFGGLLGSLSGTSSQPEERKTCPVCHTDLETIIHNGKIGCARCYTTFHSELIPTVERLHGKVNHQGKLPRSAGKAARKKAQLNSLKTKLDQAVKEQDFESAAKYRDEIKELEKGDDANA